MSYSEPLINQFTVFLRSVGVGVIIGAWYMLISAVRMMIGEKKWIYITCDIFFFFTSAVLSFIFMVLYNSGQVRYNLMLGELSGALAFHFSVGCYMLSFTEKWTHVIRRFYGKIFAPFRKFLTKILTLLKTIIRKVPTSKKPRKIKEKKIKKFNNIFKYLLKNNSKSV